MKAVRDLFPLSSEDLQILILLHRGEGLTGIGSALGAIRPSFLAGWAR